MLKNLCAASGMLGKWIFRFAHLRTHSRWIFDNFFDGWLQEKARTIKTEEIRERRKRNKEKEVYLCE